MEPLFDCLVERTETGKYRATSRDFPRVEGYGLTTREAALSLRRMILETWAMFRTTKPL